MAPERLEAMRRSMVHRGPDDHDLWHRGAVGLAHNRLSILDLSEQGRQPMRDPETGSRIVYNGEIYNFRELRRDLEGHGCRFHSATDTEVLLYAYRVWGEACLERLNGMFAFAIHDPRRGALFLARDRLGIKPLYYYRDAHCFVFASESKALLQSGAVEPRVDPEALPELLAFRHLTGGRTLLRDVRELEPGHCLAAEADGRVRERRYWEVPVGADAPEAPATLESFEEELRASVTRRLIADVPVGCALSGGVDSSIVTALACEASTSRMESFSIGFEESASDERSFARTIADALGIRNHSRVLDERTFYERLPELTWHLDEPINHPNSAGIWLLAGLARPRVTVLLSGEGGDELLGGYPRFRNVLRLRRLAGALPGVSRLARLLPDTLPGRAGLLARELARDDDGRILWSSAVLPSSYVRRLFGREGVERAEGQRRDLLARCRSSDPVDRHLYQELQTYLTSLLMRVDKMCMAHSLENRVPMLDHRVLERSFALPRSLKYDARRGKIALHELVHKRFGSELFARPKQGFGLPPRYFREQGLATLRGLATGRSFRERGWLDPGEVDRVFRDYEAGELDPDAIWMFGMLELWARVFVDGRAERPGPEILEEGSPA